MNQAEALMVAGARSAPHPLQTFKRKHYPLTADGSIRLSRGTRLEFPIGKPLPEAAIAVLSFGILVAEARLVFGLGWLAAASPALNALAKASSAF